MATQEQKDAAFSEWVYSLTPVDYVATDKGIQHPQTNIRLAFEAGYDAGHDFGLRERKVRAKVILNLHRDLALALDTDFWLRAELIEAHERISQITTNNTESTEARERADELKKLIKL